MKIKICHDRAIRGQIQTVNHLRQCFCEFARRPLPAQRLKHRDKTARQIRVFQEVPCYQGSKIVCGRRFVDAGPRLRVRPARSARGRLYRALLDDSARRDHQRAICKR